MDSLLPLFSVAFALFLLMDPIGNIPLYIAFLREIDPAKQRYIITREMIIALAIIITFNFIGEGLLRFLEITQDTVQVAGGIILFILSLRLIFPQPKTESSMDLQFEEPFIVPLAVPLVAGPSVLAAVIIFADKHTHYQMIGAIFLAWAASLLILLLSPAIEKRLGKKGIVACERLMGLILTFLAVQMFLSGVCAFLSKELCTV